MQINLINTHRLSIRRSISASKAPERARPWKVARPVITAALESRTLQPRLDRTRYSVKSRATIGKGSSWNPVDVVRRERSLQSNKLQGELRERVEAAVESLDFRVTAGDVAAKAGVKLGEAEAALQALAYDTYGGLEVSREGDVVYALRPDFRANLRRRSLLLAAAPLVRGLRAAALYLTRVAFAATLLASIGIVYLAIVVILSSRKNNRNEKRGGGRSSFSSSPAAGVNVYVDLRSFSDLAYYFNPKTDLEERSREGEMSWVASIFSFVFGDGNPNADFEKNRWQALGAMIQSRGGVVTAEEMAPFLDPPGIDRKAVSQPTPCFFSDEAFVLPALIRFGGEPLVDDATGALLYRFPGLQRTTSKLEPEATAREQQQRTISSHAWPQEKTWSVTAASGGKLALAMGLGTVNIVGVAVLGALMGDPQSCQALAVNGLGWIGSAMPVLQVYALAFFTIPAVRWLLYALRNAAIISRNEARREAGALLLKRPELSDKKLRAARDQGQRLALTDNQMIFTSSKTASEQMPRIEADDWDQRYRAAGG